MGCTPAARGELLDDIAAAALPRAVGDGVVREVRLEEREAWVTAAGTTYAASRGQRSMVII